MKGLNFSVLENCSSTIWAPVGILLCWDQRDISRVIVSRQKLGRDRDQDAFFSQPSGFSEIGMNTV